MKFGVSLGNGGPFATPAGIVAIARRADELGFDSVWASDHVVIPSRIDDEKYPYGPPGTFNPDAMQNYFEPITTLTYVAGATSRVKVGTTVLVLPQRQPLVVAKQWATLDALSGGRTILGIGAGWMREEFDALGVDTFDRRGKATDEAIRVYREIWADKADKSFDGEVYRFPALRARPIPAQPGGPPIWVGGHGRRSIRRAAQFGDGWHLVRGSLEEVRQGTAVLHELCGQYGRDPSSLVVSNVLSVYPPGGGPTEPKDFDLTGGAAEQAERIRRYADAGCEYLVIRCYPAETLSGTLESLERFAREVRPLLD
ncbi:MAG: LLM class F420-dependent oxidoreductase [Chloroflexota bacterium]